MDVDCCCNGLTDWFKLHALPPPPLPRFAFGAWAAVGWKARLWDLQSRYGDSCVNDALALRSERVMGVFWGACVQVVLVS